MVTGDGSSSFSASKDASLQIRYGAKSPNAALQRHKENTCFYKWVGFQKLFLSTCVAVVLTYLCWPQLPHLDVYVRKQSFHGSMALSNY